MRRASAFLLCLSLAGAFPLWTAPPAAATEPSNYGWWYRLNSQQTILPPPLPGPPRPASIPEDGVFVAQDLPQQRVDDDVAVEALAMSAFLYEAPDGPSAIFELQIANGTIPEGAAVYACPTPDVISNEDGGFWESRPRGDCADDSMAIEGELVGVPAESVRWYLPGEFQDFPAYWNFVLEPSGVTPFQIAFEPPGPGSFQVEDGPGIFDDDAPPPPPASGLPPGPAETFLQQFTDGEGFVTAPGPTFSGPDTGAFETQPPPPVALPQPQARPTVLPEAADDTMARAVALSILFLLTVALAAATRQASRPAVAAAEASEPEAEDEGDAVIEVTRVRVGGIGRFARPRGAGPRRLV